MGKLELTKAQVLMQPLAGLYTSTLSRVRDPATWGDKIRKMRKNPVIAMCRDLVRAPVLAAEWSYESVKEKAPAGAREFIQEMMEPHRHHLLRTTMNGWMDWGWAAHELIIDFENGTTNLRKIKPLLQDYTEIWVDDYGVFTHFEQPSIQGDLVSVQREQALLTYTDVEGTDWYGNPILGTAEEAFDGWTDTKAELGRYEKRVAGAHWVLVYPIGTTPVYNGETDVDNFEIAKDILEGLGTSSKIALPRKYDEVLTDLNGQRSPSENAWSLELVTDGGGGGDGFLNRLAYWDKCMVRAFRMPERAVLEGQFGTKAEAEAHLDFAITVMEQRHLEASILFNWYLVNKMLRYEYGGHAENTVYIKPAPLSDVSRAILRELYSTVVSDKDELLRLDRDAITKQLGIPTTRDATVPDDPAAESTEALPDGDLVEPTPVA